MLVRGVCVVGLSGVGVLLREDVTILLVVLSSGVIELSLSLSLSLSDSEKKRDTRASKPSSYSRIHLYVTRHKQHQNKHSPTRTKRRAQDRKSVV